MACKSKFKKMNVNWIRMKCSGKITKIYKYGYTVYGNSWEW